MRAQLALPLCSLLLTTVGCFNDQRPPAEESAMVQSIARKEALHLGTTWLFAFGGTGYAGSISEGEKQFFKIYNDHRAAEHFDEIFQRGTDEAKIYALCGLYELDRQRFKELTRNPRALPARVEMMNGCIGFHQSGEKIVEKIAAGGYSDYLRSAGRQ